VGSVQLLLPCVSFHNPAVIDRGPVFRFNLHHTRFHLQPLRCSAHIVPAPPAFKELGTQQAGDGSTWKTAQPQDAALRGKWWEIYQEPELDALEDKQQFTQNGSKGGD
jgi:hypothetical protein